MNIDPIWLSHYEEYGSLIHESRRIVLYPKLVELVLGEKPESVLDYGCGDGSVAKLLGKNLPIALYDISERALLLAKANLRDYNITIYQSSKEIPRNKFDCVILSLVLMTIPHRLTIAKVFGELARAKTRDGKVFLTVTHPCFRQYHFSTFHTEYSNGRKFDYFKEGSKFKVFLKDAISGKQLTFADYHWSMQTTINYLTNEGLKITGLYELRDKGRNRNKNYPAYLIIVAQ
jgi:ubiquinone/menaquinone biosynthesis C-methylase UbiE